MKSSSKCASNFPYIKENDQKTQYNGTLVVETSAKNVSNQANQ
jgi:hypothetical protein